MNQSRAFFISLAFAFVGMGLVAFYISDQEDRILKAQGDIVQVVIAKTAINEMQTLDLNNLTTQQIPSSYAQPGSVKIIDKGKEKDQLGLPGFIKDISALNDMVTLVPIRENEQIMVTKLAPKGAETGLSSQVAANKRGMSIPVDDVSGVTKLIKPGDHVDIIGSITYPAPDGTKQTELKTLLQNISILAVGSVITNNIPQVFENDPLTQKKVPVSGRNGEFSTVSVEVTPDQAQIILYALEQGGKLYLTLRNPVDRVETPVGSTTVDEVLGPDSKRAEAREKEQRRILEEARRQAELERLKNQAPGGEARKPAAASDPLESGGGVLE